ncbi:SDR family oxidoreductase [Paenibacillus mesophilus]|uniref:NAD(P)-dependent oxidoreductase n=1 Tax=Paenibacillus mesophilus TaxID=2582849 RepID=UPI00110E321F|nr:NAD(P)-binding oxidoreductase [Paenibacillus mesophilus]TMV49151.1 SDR family oxidoreductase [Paenibacillus mesophilus]
MNVIIFGANGSLGRHLVSEGLLSGCHVTAFARKREKGPERSDNAPQSEKLTIVEGDATDPQQVYDALSGCDAAIISAGNPKDADAFARIVDTIVTQADGHPRFGGRLWMLAGAALLDIPHTDRNSLGLPGMPPMYRIHQNNYDRIRQSKLDWSVLCPGPMVENSPDSAYMANLRISAEELPLAFSESERSLPDAELSGLIARKLPELIIPYKEAARLILNHLERSGPFSGKRVGIALPEGSGGEKAGWSLGQ